MIHKSIFITLLGLLTINSFPLTISEGYATVNPILKMTSLETPVDYEAEGNDRLIDIDKYKIEIESLSPGQTVSSIMMSHGIDNKTVHDVSIKAGRFLKINEISSGLTYIVVRQTKDPLEIKYLILNVFSDRSIVIDFENASDVFWGVLKTDKLSKRISGSIQSSFWKTMKRHGMTTKHILQLTALFNSRIKFNKMTPQDSFEITLEEYKIKNQVIKNGEILSALMNVKRKKLSAFRFEHHGSVSYYDEKGKNLSGAFLKSPVKYRKITSGFSYNRNHPILKKNKRHPAIDFGAPEGTPVMSVGDGVIEKYGYSNSAGNYIEIIHPNAYKTSYLHLSAFAEGIQNGLKISRGNVIGYVGSTGVATGPHLDFRISKNGRYLDFLKSPLPEGKSVDKECFEIFLKTIQNYTNKTTQQKNT